jgi:hypothetical protein
MELLKTHHTEQRQRQLIIDVATGVSDLVEVASLNNLDLEELQHYQTHGEGILSPEQLPKAKLELFKLKYPDGKPRQRFEQVIRQTLRKSKSLIFVLVVVIPSLTGLGIALVSVLGPSNLQESLVFGSVCGLSTLVLFALIAIVWMTFRTSRHLVTGKIDEIVYNRERRKVVSPHEAVGGLELAVSSDELQGGLVLAQEAGGLEVVTFESSEGVVFDHTSSADVMSEEVAARDLDKTTW